MKRKVKTGLGITEGTYYQRAGEPTPEGEIQGTADTPLLYFMLSSVAIKAHKSFTPGLSLESPTMKRAIKHHNVVYVDDADGHVSADATLQDPTSEAVTRMHISAQGWNDVNNLTGGSLAYHKTKWQMVCWEKRNGIKTLRETTSNQLTINSWMGASTTIAYGKTNEPNIGLGFHLCPNGDQTHQYNHTHGAIKTLCSNVSSANLTEREARQTITQQLVPKLSYPLHLTSFTQKQSNAINSTIREAFLPIIRFNWHLPGAVLYGPMSMGGMEFPETYTLQNQTQIPFMIEQLRWDKTLANDILVTLDHVQLLSGFTTPVMQNTANRIDYIGTSYLVEMRHRLLEIEGTIWIEHAWTPPLQRQRDKSIMERFTAIPRITTGQLKQANTVRLYLRVISIADLTDPEGSTIPDGMLTGDWQAGSDLLWPDIPCPPKWYWATFCKCILATFSTRAPRYQPAHFSIRLDINLESWHAVPRNTWYPCYKSDSQLFLRQNDTNLITIMTALKVKGYYHATGTTKILSLASPPITHQ